MNTFKFVRIAPLQKLNRCLRVNLALSERRKRAIYMSLGAHGFLPLPNYQHLPTLVELHIYNNQPDQYSTTYTHLKPESSHKITMDASTENGKDHKGQAVYPSPTTASNPTPEGVPPPPASPSPPVPAKEPPMRVDLNSDEDWIQFQKDIDEALDAIHPPLLTSSPSIEEFPAVESPGHAAEDGVPKQEDGPDPAILSDDEDDENGCMPQNNIGVLEERKTDGPPSTSWVHTESPLAALEGCFPPFSFEEHETPSPPRNQPHRQVETEHSGPSNNNTTQIHRNQFTKLPSQPRTIESLLGKYLKSSSSTEVPQTPNHEKQAGKKVQFTYQGEEKCRRKLARQDKRSQAAKGEMEVLLNNAQRTVIDAYMDPKTELPEGAVHLGAYIVNQQEVDGLFVPALPCSAMILEAFTRIPGRDVKADELSAPVVPCVVSIPGGLPAIPEQEEEEEGEPSAPVTPGPTSTIWGLTAIPEEDEEEDDGGSAPVLPCPAPICGDTNLGYLKHWRSHGDLEF
ncbi:hypothetical protein F5B20DRAFT_562102 [Whalleya microplaca]|nr:hypothetical protein F5B20DRAFT_562102 [Whalleya microplaca]